MLLMLGHVYGPAASFCSKLLLILHNAAKIVQVRFELLQLQLQIASYMKHDIGVGAL